MTSKQEPQESMPLVTLKQETQESMPLVTPKQEPQEPIPLASDQPRSPTPPALRPSTTELSDVVHGAVTTAKNEEAEETETATMTTDRDESPNSRRSSSRRRTPTLHLIFDLGDTQAHQMRALEWELSDKMRGFYGQIWPSRCRVGETRPRATVTSLRALASEMWHLDMEHREARREMLEKQSRERAELWRELPAGLIRYRA